jgi:hypothetical protein
MAEALDVGNLVSSVADVDVISYSDDDLSSLVVKAELLLNAAHALSAVALAELQRRGLWADEGALSAPGWVAVRTGTPARVLRARLRAGRGLRVLPTAAAAARAGLLSAQHLAALTDCARRHPDLAARDEALFVTQAEALDADGFGVVSRQWLEHADAVDGPDPAEAATMTVRPT